MPQNLSYTPIADGYSPRCDSAYPTGNRPANAADLVLNGTTAHGDTVTITTVGGINIFGSAPPQKHAELFGTYYADGNEVAVASAWGQNSFTESATGLRVSNVGRMHKGLGVGRLSEPYNAASIPPSSKNLYLSYHAKFGSDPFRTLAANIASQTGSLTGGADRSRGERCTVTLADLSVATGWVTFENGSFVTVEFDNSVSMANFQGAVIVGDTSGFSVTTGAESTSVGATKYYRVWHGGTGDANSSLFIRSHTSGGNADYDTYINSVLQNYSELDLINQGRCPVGSWHFVEAEFIWVEAESSWHWINKIDGQVWSDIPLCPASLGTEFGLHPLLIGLDTPGTSSAPSLVSEADLGTSEFIDSLVYQTDFKRVVLTDNADYSLSTKFEIQRHTAWTNPKISLVLNSGEIAAGGYLHIFNADNTHFNVIGV